MRCSDRIDHTGTVTVEEQPVAVIVAVIIMATKMDFANRVQRQGVQTGLQVMILIGIKYIDVVHAQQYPATQRGLHRIDVVAESGERGGRARPRQEVVEVCPVMRRRDRCSENLAGMSQPQSWRSR